MITRLDLASATISAVKIRAVTLGLDLPLPEVSDAPFDAAASFLRAARQAFAEAGTEVQTTRVSGADLGKRLPQSGDALSTWAAQTEERAKASGVEFLSLGRLPASAHELVAEHLAPILAAGEIVFLSADLIEGGLPSVAMAQACAHAVQAADVVVNAFDAPGGISDIEDRLVAELEAACAPIEKIANQLAAEHGYP